MKAPLTFEIPHLDFQAALQSNRPGNFYLSSFVNEC